MGFFTARERTELGKSLETEMRVPGRVQEKVRKPVRDDFAPRRRPAENDLASHVGSLLQREASTSLREIDDLIDELRRRRAKLLSESARVQSEIIEYAKLSQSTMQSTKIVADSLAHFNKVPGAFSMRESHVEDIPSEEDRESGSDQQQLTSETEPRSRY
jgi:hypothetical protein